MFSPLQFSRKRRGWSAVASFAVHAAVIAPLFLARHVEPEVVIPTSVRWGDGDRSSQVLTWVAAAPEEAVSPEKSLRVPLPKKREKERTKAPLLAQKPKPGKQEIAGEGDIGDRAARAGRPYGSLLDGPMSGHDLRPAYPVHFPDPPVRNSELPQGVAGEVVVEVTIDQHGNVVETKLVRGIGHGIDDRVIQTVAAWRYRPAMLDGRPIASRNDVHFRYPS